MSSVDVKNPRLPNVWFSLDPVLNEAKTRDEKREVWDDVEMVHITFPGNTQTELAAPAMDNAGWDDAHVHEMTYAEKYNAEYLAFKDGRAEVAGGTPLDRLPGLTEGKRRELRAVHVKTVEQLASLDGAQLKRIGMGGRDLKNLATEYLATHKDTESTDTLLATIARLNSENAALKAGQTEGQKRTAAAVAAKDAPATPTDIPDVPGVADGDSETDPNAPIHTDKFDHDKDGKSGGSLPAELKDTAEAFEGFTDEDIAIWLKDANVEVDGRWGHKRLLEEAKAVLDKQGKKKK